MIEILESTPVQKNFLKDSLLSNPHGIQSLQAMVEFATSTSLKDISNEQVINKFKLSNQYILKIINGLVKNHPDS